MTDGLAQSAGHAKNLAKVCSRRDQTVKICKGLGVKNPPFTYHRPETLDEALLLLSQIGEDAKIMSGGQSLLPIMAIRLGQPENIIDISRIRGLDSIDTESGVVMFGALVTHSQAEASSVVKEKVPLLHKAMPYIGHRAIRNRGTMCGSLAHADPAAELPAVALALGSELIAASTDGARFIAAEDFFTGFLSTTLQENELLVGVRFHQATAGSLSSVQELSRRHGDFALVGLACALQLSDDGTIDDAALSFFGVASTPSRASEAEQQLVGSRPTTELFDEVAKMVSNELDPPSDAHASSNYRKHAAGVLTRRALEDCMSQIGVPA